ncbi:MAG: hypothetical protein M3Q68_06735 [Actinomycetota bacterium]|nr:hypothetical protein [Actinomycetota bacterium]
MIFVVLAFVVVVAGVSVLAVAGTGGRSWGWTAVIIAGAGGALLVVMVVLVVVVVGRPAVGDQEPPTKESATSPTPTSPEVTLRRVLGPPARLDGVVELAADRSPLRPPPMTGGLRAGQVIEVRASGFLRDADGVIAQCDAGERCTNSYLVHTDSAGRASVQYRLAPGKDASRSIELVMEVDLERASAILADGSAASRAQLRAIESASTDDGPVGVRVEDARPNAVLRALRCPVDAAALAECDRPKEATVRVSADGSAEFAFEPLQRAERVVVLEGASVIAEPLDLVGGAAPESSLELNARRVIGGFAVALLLLVAAIVLIRSTDWQAPAEAGTPFLDAASLEGP